MKIAVIGAGAFGYALSLLLTRTHENIEVYIYDIQKEYIDSLIKDKHHSFFFSEIITPNNLKATNNQDECLKNAEIMV